MSAQSTPSAWCVLNDTYRKKHVFLIGRIAGPRGRVEYLLNERTERKQRYFDATIAQHHADKMNVAIAKADGSAS